FPIDTEVIDTIGGLKETIRQKKKEITTSQRRIKLFLAMKNNSWLPNDDPAVLKLARGEIDEEIGRTVKGEPDNNMINESAPKPANQIHVLVRLP
ncbi:hypothetical protein PHYSODRAFT_405579, partial [Phytophthora sojae]